MCNKNNR